MFEMLAKQRDCKGKRADGVDAIKIIVVSFTPNYANSLLVPGPLIEEYADTIISKELRLLINQKTNYILIIGKEITLKKVMIVIRTENQARSELFYQLKGRTRNNFSRSSEMVKSNNQMVHNSTPNENESLLQDFLKFKNEMREILGQLIQKDKVPTISTVL